MPHSDLLDELIYTTRHGAGFMLRRFGRVVPGGVYFVNADDPLVDFCFPKEDHPKASDGELFARAEEELRRWAAKPETCAIAMVTEVVIDGRRVMKMQAETRSAPGTGAPTRPGSNAPARECVIRHWPLRRKLWWWVLGEAEEGERLIVERFLGEGA